MTDPLEPFHEPNAYSDCPKCGVRGGRWSVSHKPADFDTDTPEHLRLSCGNCGYERRMKTKDAR